MAEKIKEFQGKYKFLSNFWSVKVRWAGYEFPTLENAYQAAKCKDAKWMDMFLHISPGQAKRLGRLVPMRLDWNDVKLKIMHVLVMKKFDDNPELKKQLLATYPLVLEEGNNWGDDFWGINLKTGEGLNMLGRILMKVRDRLKEKNNES